MATPRFASPSNVFIPAATGQVIGYIREPGKFKLLDYCQMVKSKSQDEAGKPICVYCILDPDAPARVGPVSGPTVTNPTIQGNYGPGVDSQWRWAPGDDAPRGNIAWNFVFQTVEMHRRAFPYEYDAQTADTADLPIEEIYEQAALQIAMTVKTDRVIRMLETSGNWPASAVADANTLNGGRGKWNLASSDENSPNFNAIRLSVQQAAVDVVKATNASVQPEDLRMIISPNAALKMGSTGEIYSFVKSSQFAKERQEGRNQLNEQYGMPRIYAGLEWIVEDAVAVLEYPNAAGTPATTTRNWVKSDSSAIMVSRKGGLNGVYGAPTFSTVQLFYYKYEMAVEGGYDDRNKKHWGRIVDQYAEVLAATRAGKLITAIF